MRNDVLAWSVGQPTAKLISKETLNHPILIEMVTGRDVYIDTPEAYRRAYAALGIDIINRVPLRPAPVPTRAGASRPHPTRPYTYGHLGVYDTVMRHTYACKSPEEVWDLDVSALGYDDLLTPVPHPVSADDIRLREAAIGEIGLYYPMLYTTLFMWGVEELGWEVFLMAAALEPDRFHEHVLVPCANKSRVLVTEMARASDNPFIFVHDDLADARGPMFRPSWYDRYIFPHYPDIFAPAKALGKKIIFVADGNMSAFLPQLVEAGVDGLMFETPATPLPAVLESFGKPGRFFIGGIATRTLTFGTPGEIRHMVIQLIRVAGDYPGFALASGGGLHDNIPIQNLIAYFDARAEVGATPLDWRTRSR
jgi:hypothetical protein